MYILLMARGKMYKAGKKKTAEMRKIAKDTVMKLSEPKYHDVTIGACPDYGAGSMLDLSAIAQGTTDISRTGDEVYATSIQCRGYVSCADATNIIRLIFFVWKLESVPTGDDILATTSKGSINYVSAPYHKDGRTNFVVKYDKTYALSLGNDTDQKVFEFSKKLNKKIHFNAGTTTGKNKLYLFALSDSGVASNPCVNCISRIYYRDL